MRGRPMLAMCTRIWCVRPVRIRTRISETTRPAPSASAPSPLVKGHVLRGWNWVTALTHPGSPSSQVRTTAPSPPSPSCTRSGVLISVQFPVGGSIFLPTQRATYSLVTSPPANWDCNERRAGENLSPTAAITTPEVSLSNLETRPKGKPKLREVASSSVPVFMPAGFESATTPGAAPMRMSMLLLGGTVMSCVSSMRRRHFLWSFFHSSMARCLPPPCCTHPAMTVPRSMPLTKSVFCSIFSISKFKELCSPSGDAEAAFSAMVKDRPSGAGRSSLVLSRCRICRHRCHSPASRSAAM
mmetsp:Transcript_26494/g.61814  ORF Transcript_26494/g.61814 Transcript_26494/m.61814 type:complete len:299 (+) Transcript_26494:226-1122(+)